MSDTIKVELEISLQDVTRSRIRQVGEDDWEEVPWTWSQAVVEEGARQLVTKLGGDEPLNKAISEVVRDTVRRHVISRLEQVLTEPIVVTHGTYGERTKATTVTEVIDEEIKRQLMANRGHHGGSPSVLEQVIRTEVSTRLDADLREAFQTARNAMLKAAQEAGSKALIAAVAKAVG